MQLNISYQTFKVYQKLNISCAFWFSLPKVRPDPLDYPMREVDDPAAGPDLVV